MKDETIVLAWLLVMLILNPQTALINPAENLSPYWTKIELDS